MEIRESIWKTRFKLFLRSAKQNWELFKEKKIAIFGLVVIILFGVFGALYPVYTSYMGDKYVRELETISRLAYETYESNLQKVFLESSDNIDYSLKSQKILPKIESEIDGIFKTRGMVPKNTFRDVLAEKIESFFDYDSRKSMYDVIGEYLKTSKDIEEASKKIAKYFYLKKIDEFINDVGVYEKSQIVWRFLNEKKIRENLKKLASDPKAFADLISLYRIYYRPSEIEENLDSIIDSLLAKAHLDVFPLLTNPGVLEGAVKLEDLKKAISDPDVLFYISEIYELGMSYDEIKSSASELAEAFAESPDFDTYSHAILKKEITEMFSKSRKEFRDFLQKIAKGHIKYEIARDFDFNYIAKEDAMKNTFEFFDEKFPNLVGLWKLLDSAKKDVEKGEIEKAKVALLELSRRLDILANLKRSVPIITFWVDSLEGGNCGYKNGVQRIGLNFRNIDPNVAPYLSNTVETIFKPNEGKLRKFVQKIQYTLSSSKKGSTEKDFRDMASEARKMASSLPNVSAADFERLGQKIERFYLSREEDENLSKLLEDTRKLLEDASKRVIVYDLHYLAGFFLGKIESYLGKGKMFSEVEMVDERYKEILKGGSVGKIDEILKEFNSLVQKLAVEVASLKLDRIKLTQYYSELTTSLVNLYDQYLNAMKDVLERTGLEASDETISELIRAAAFIELEEVSKAYFFSSRPYDPVTGNDGLLSNPSKPSALHPFGTDPLGRDILSQMMYSTPREFVLGVTAAFITVFIGTIIGATSAYYGGAVDTFFMRLADIIMLFPSLPLLMVLSAFMELTLFKLALIIGIISGFGSITIVLKAQALTVKVRPFIEAAKSAGGSDWYIIRKHIIPNILPLSFLYMMFSVTGAIFTEAVLSFFGLVNIRMSWGIILYTASSQGYLIGTNIGTFWWLWVPPGVAITLICSAFYFLGRGLEEIVNPRLRKR